MPAPALIRYRSFISYSHADTKWAKWLHRQLESFRIEKGLVGRETALGAIPKVLRPIFRDRDDFSAGYKLKEQTLAALDSSATLVVMCSPASARSRYVNEEVRLFKERHPERPVIPVIVDGKPDDADRECFAPAVRFEVEPDGKISNRPAELLAADLRHEADGPELAAAKVIARLLGLSTDDIFRRAERDRRRAARVRHGILVVLTLLALTATASAVYAWQQLKTNEAFLNLTLKRATGIVATAVTQAEKYNVPRTATLELLGRAEGLFDDMAQLGRATPELRHRKAWMLIQFARNYALLGDTGKQRERALEAERLLAELATENPKNAVYQFDLSFAQNEIGDVLVARGNLAEALKAFRNSLSIRDRLTRTDPNNTDQLRDLSVSHNRVGDVLVTQGHLAEALEHYRAALALRERLIKTDMGNIGWQRDLSVSHTKIGDIMVVLGNYADAQTQFRASQAIFYRLTSLAPNNAGWQRDLAVSHTKIGDISVTQSNFPDALKSFRASSAILERLTTTDPVNTSWQRDLSVSYSKIGGVLMVQANYPEARSSFSASFAIIERLARGDPNNAIWQRDLGVLNNRMADAWAAQGNESEAQASFLRSQNIFERLAKIDPDNADWQRDLAVSYERLGDVHQALGKNAEALQNYEHSLSIYEALLKTNPNNFHILANSTLPLMRLGSLNPDRRVEYFSRALTILRNLDHADKLESDQKSAILWLEQELQ